MERSKFILTAIDFIERAILPKVKTENLRWFAGGILPFLVPILSNKMDEVSGPLSFLGIMDSDGGVSVEGLKKFFENAYKQQPELRIDIVSVLPKNTPEIVRDWLDGVVVKLSQQDSKDFIIMLEERN